MQYTKTFIYLTCFFVFGQITQNSWSKSNIFRPVIQVGHSSGITCLEISSDGQFVLSGSTDRTIKLWELDTGREVRTYSGHKGPVVDIAISNDNSFALSASKRDNTVIFWDICSGKQLGTFKHRSNVHAIALAPDQVHFLSGDEDGNLTYWDLKSRQSLKRFLGHDRFITAIDFSPNGKIAASGDIDGTVLVWDVSKNNKLNKIRHLKAVTVVSFSPNGRYLASGSFDNTIKIWDYKSGVLVQTLLHDGAILDLSYSPDGSKIVSGCKDKRLRIWDLKTGFSKMLLDNKTIDAVAVSPDGNHILTGGRSKELLLIDLNQGYKLRSLQKHASHEYPVVYSPRGDMAVSVSNYKSLTFWNMKSGHAIKSFIADDNFITSISISPDGKKILAGGFGAYVNLWESENGFLEKKYKWHDKDINIVKFSPDGRLAIAGGDDKKVYLWNIESGELVQTLKLDEIVITADFSPDGNSLVTGSNENLILWELHSGKVLFRVKLLNSINKVAFSPLGNLLFLVNTDALCIFDTKSGRLLSKPIKFSGGYSHTFDISPNGDFLVIGSKKSPFEEVKKKNKDDDKTLILWDIQNNCEVPNFADYHDSINSVCFSPNGKHILFSSKGALMLWDVNTGTEIATLSISQDGEFIIVTPDGYFDNSPEGTEEIFWASQNGIETFPFELFASKFKRPEIIKNRLQGKINIGVPAPDLSIPPRILLKDNRKQIEISNKNYTLDITVTGEIKVDNVQVFVNGKLTIQEHVDSFKKDLKLNIPIYTGTNRVTVVAFDERGFYSNPANVDIISSIGIQEKPNVYILSVGVSKYPNLPYNWQLNYAHQDANLFAKVLANSMGKLYGKVYTELLANEKVTVNSVFSSLEEMSNNMTENDIAVILLAGHGVQERGKFYFLTNDAELTKDFKGKIDWSMLETAFSKIRGRIILFLDACHSSSLTQKNTVPNNTLAQKLFIKGRSSVMVFSASKGRQESLENPGLGNGSGEFTYSIIQGLTKQAKKADYNQNGIVEFMELVDYVCQSVSTNTSGAQTPWLSHKEFFGDLPITIVN